MQYAKLSNNQKTIILLFLLAVILLLLIIFLPGEYRSASILSGLIGGLGAIAASGLGFISNKKNTKLKYEVQEKIRSLYKADMLSSQEEKYLRVIAELNGITKDKNTAEGIIAGAHLRDVILRAKIKKAKDEIDMLKGAMEQEKQKREFESNIKQHTITQMFLIDVKQSLLKARNIMTCAMIVTVAISHFVLPSFGYLFVVPSVFFLLLVAKEWLITFRIEKGYFGANKFEVIQLLSYIEENKSNIDFNGPGGSKRKVFKPVIDNKDCKPDVLGGEVFL